MAKRMGRAVAGYVNSPKQSNKGGDIYGTAFSNQRKGSLIRVNESFKITQENHDKLLRFIDVRMLSSLQQKSANVERFREIDKALAGHIVPTDDDKKRLRDNRRGKGPKTVDESIQYALMQLDEAVTFMLGVHAPETGMYQSVTSADNQSIANAVTNLMNKHGKVYHHYRNMSRSVLDAFKFNLGGWVIEWDVQTGAKLVTKNADGSPLVPGSGPLLGLNELISSGNRLEAIDPYNFSYDPAVYPVDVPEKGEFAAMTSMVRKFDIDLLTNNGFYFDTKDWTYSQGYKKYYEPRPIISHAYLPSGAPTSSWEQLFATVYGMPDPDVGFYTESVEKTKFYCWICPKEYGLGKDASDKMEIWRFHLIDNKYIARADQMVNVFNKLPFGVMMPNEDGMDLQSRTFGEMLLPFQNFASSQMNIKQRSDRKRLNGVTVYNRRVIPLFDLGALEGGLVSANPPGEDYDLNKAVKQFNDVPDTSHIMEDISATLGLMQRILPTTQASQVASLERATKYQAASYVQASNKRNLKLAKIIEDQCFGPTRNMQLRNLEQFQESYTVRDQDTGQNVEVTKEAIIDADLDFNISDGLKGIDKLAITDSMEQIINMLLQSPIVHDYDMGKFINYFFQLQGDEMDFTQFKYQTPFDALPPEQKQVAFQLLQQVMQKQQQDQVGQKQNEIAGRGTGSGGDQTGGQPGQPQLPAPPGIQ